MATDTFESRGINSVIWTTGPRPKVREVKANGADIAPGYIGTHEGETFPDIDLQADDERRGGIFTERYDTDIDTAFADDDEHVPILYARENVGVGVWVFVAPSTAVTIGARYKAVSGKASVEVVDTTDEECILLEAAETVAADYSYTKLRKFMIIAP